MMSRVHYARPHDVMTACGKVALLDDDTRILETDLDKNQIDCRTCLKILSKKQASI
jgi:hypothetical protein